MLVLGLDTSTPAVAVALVELGTGQVPRRLAECVVVDGRRHGELLAQGIAAVLAEAGARSSDLGAVGVGLGPGPFTGLRVGVVTAATLADALGIPAYGTCSLDALGSGERIAMTDARRREVYWARYDPAGARTEGPHVDKPADLVERLQGVPVLGDGAMAYAGVLAGLDLRAEPRYPSAVRIAELARTPELLPLYLRRPDADAPAAPKRVTA